MSDAMDHYTNPDDPFWQSRPEPQPTEYDPDLAAFLSQSLDDEPMWSCVVIAKNLHAAGFRRAPAEPAVTDEMVERGLKVSREQAVAALAHHSPDQDERRAAARALRDVGRELEPPDQDQPDRAARKQP